MEQITAGFALTGSFCTFEQAIEQMKALKEAGVNVVPIMSEKACTTDTRFGAAEDFKARIEAVCENKIIDSIVKAEPIGPKKMFDIMIVAPCTGNTLAKMALGIVDGTVTMAAKSHLRNARPLLLAVSTNDALGNAAKNIGQLLNYKNIYFVPMRQDDPVKKPRSVVADFTKIQDAMEDAMNGTQIQPILSL